MVTNAIGISAGGGHSLALKSDGTLAVWGRFYIKQYFGDIGIAYDIDAYVPSGISNVVAIASGGQHCLALKSDGTVLSWGNLTIVPPLVTNVVAIAAGAEHSVAMKADGTVVAWDANWAEQTDIPPGLSNVVAIAAGYYYSLALIGDGGPTVTVKPASRIAYAGNRVIFRALAAGGVAPLNYQWQFNGANIIGATGSALTLLVDIQQGGIR